MAQLWNSSPHIYYITSRIQKWAALNTRLSCTIKRHLSTWALVLITHGPTRGERGTESQKHWHISSHTERVGWKELLELTSSLTPLLKGTEAGTHRKEGRDKQHKEKTLGLEGGEKPGPVHCFLRMPLCHLKYCQRRSFWSSSEGSSTPTLGSRRRERERDGDNRGDRSSGHMIRTTAMKEKADLLFIESHALSSPGPTLQNPESHGGYYVSMSRKAIMCQVKWGSIRNEAKSLKIQCNEIREIKCTKAPEFTQFFRNPSVP